MKDKIKTLAKKYKENIIEIRRYLHQHPELSFKEEQTANYIIKNLESWGITYQSGIANHGIVAIIEGRNPNKKVIALRADMDALPIQEENDIPYKSKNNGIMHACGHDAHTASLLGVIKILYEIKNEFEGTVKCIFQPAEEKIPGGAKQMIEEGVLSNDPIPELIVGQHVYPELPVGKIGIKQGSYMASSDELYITVKGKGGHAAIPEKITNTVLIASEVIIALQKISTELAPKDIPTVINVGKVIANGATNVIPNEVYMEGTFRTLNEEWRAKAHELIEKICNETAEKYGGKAEILIKKGYPVLINDNQLAESVRNYAQNYIGTENVEELVFRMTSEDFAYFSQEIPSTFYRLGTTPQGATDYSPLHSPTFTIDEDALEIGMGTMAYIAYKLLMN